LVFGIEQNARVILALLNAIEHTVP